jgi:hypothetical protein
LLNTIFSCQKEWRSQVLLAEKVRYPSKRRAVFLSAISSLLQTPSFLVIVGKRRSILSGKLWKTEEQEKAWRIMIWRTWREKTEQTMKNTVDQHRWLTCP